MLHWIVHCLWWTTWKIEYCVMRSNWCEWRIVSLFIMCISVVLFYFFCFILSYMAICDILLQQKTKLSTFLCFPKNHGNYYCCMLGTNNSHFNYTLDVCHPQSQSQSHSKVTDGCAKYNDTKISYVNSWIEETLEIFFNMWPVSSTTEDCCCHYNRQI